MFSRLFCSVMFIAAVLGNVVMAGKEHKNSELYDFIQIVVDPSVVNRTLDYKDEDTKTNRYSNDVLENAVLRYRRDPDDSTVDDILYNYVENFNVYPDIYEWIVTVLAYTQDRRIKNAEYNNANGIEQEQVASTTSIVSSAAEVGLKADTLCQNLILEYMHKNTRLEELLSNTKITKDIKEDILEYVSYFVSGCVFVYGENNRPIFPTSWRERSLTEFISDYVEKLNKYLD